MKLFAISLAAAAFVPTILAQSTPLTINSPTGLATCQPTLLQWSGGIPPYFISVIPGGQPTASALKTFDSTSGGSLTWNVDLAANTSISLEIKDSTGAMAFSGQVTIAAGSSTSCATSVSASAANGTSATSAGATSVGSPNPASGTTTSLSSSARAAATTVSSGSPTIKASSTSASSNAASRSFASYGVAGLMGFVGAALF